MPFRHNKSLVPLKNFQTSHIFFSASHHFGLSFLVSHFFTSDISSYPHFLSLSLSWIFLNPLPLLLSSSLLKTHHFFSKISNTKILPKITNPTQSKVSLSSSHFYICDYVVGFFVLSSLKVGLFTGRSESGLCPTRNWPDGIRFWENSPAVDCRTKRVGQIRLQRVLGRVSRRQRSEITTKKRRGNCKKRWEKPRSDENLIEIYEISSDLALISQDSMRFR